MRPEAKPSPYLAHTVRVYDASALGGFGQVASRHAGSDEGPDAVRSGSALRASLGPRRVRRGAGGAAWRTGIVAHGPTRPRAETRRPPRGLPALAHAGLPALGDAGRGGPGAPPRGARGRHLRGAGLRGRRPLHHARREPLVVAQRAGRLQLPRAQRADLRARGRPAGRVVLQPGSGQLDRGDRRPHRLAPALSPRVHGSLRGRRRDPLPEPPPLARPQARRVRGALPRGRAPGRRRARHPRALPRRALPALLDERRAAR